MLRFTFVSPVTSCYFIILCEFSDVLLTPQVQPEFRFMSFTIFYSNKSQLKKLLLDSGGLLLALQPLGCGGDDADEDHTAECGRLLSDWFNSPLSGLTSQLHSLYFSLVIGCLSSLMGGIKVELSKKHLGAAAASSVTKMDGVSPPLSKKPRLVHICPYEASNFDLLLLLDDGTRVPANREAVAGQDGSRRAGSDYFGGLLRGGFGEAQRSAEEAIRIKDVSTGMLVPVLHYLHGCRFTQDAETRERDGERRGRCQTLDTLVFEGLRTGGRSAEDSAFQNTALGQMMIGACRFLVTDLQRELEDLCVSLLLSCSTTPAGRAASAPAEDGAGRAASKPDRDTLESAEENLASRTSELELTSAEVQTGRPDRPRHQADGRKTSDKASRGVNTATDSKTIRTVAPVSKPSSGTTPDKSLDLEELRLRPKVKLLALLSPSEAGPGGGALAALLPQVYWFSQRYSYPALGRACLSLLLGCQDCPRPFASSSLAGDCLRRLAREADCTETLRQDLLSLASAALS